MKIEYSNNPEALFKTLAVGDGFVTKTQDREGKVMDVHIVVLRREGDNIWFSRASNIWHSMLSAWNPYRWNGESLVDKDGDISGWFNPSDIVLYCQVAATQAAQYAAVPRVDSLTVELPTDDDFNQFFESPVVNILSGILHNGEAGDLRSQVALILNTLGLARSDGQVSKEHLMGLAYVIGDLLREQSRVMDKMLQNVIVVGMPLGDDDGNASQNKKLD